MTPDARSQSLETLLLPSVATAYTVAVLLTGDSEAATALVERAVTDLCRTADPAPSPDALRAALLRMVVAGFTGAEGPDGNGQAMESDRRGRHRDVAAAIRNLPTDYRVPVAVYFAGQFAYDEIAGIIDRPVAWVRTHLHAGRRMLRPKPFRAAHATG